MVIWDSGTFDIDRTQNDLGLLQQFRNGNLKLVFSGQKIKGRYALVRTGERKGKESWLLIKKKDGFSTDLFYDAEALIAPSQKTSRKYPREIAPGKIIQPMLAGSAKEIFNDPQWIYELKCDKSGIDRKPGYDRGQDRAPRAYTSICRWKAGYKVRDSPNLWSREDLETVPWHFAKALARLRPCTPLLVPYFDLFYYL